LAALHDRAERGDVWATDRLLTRPAISTDATPYWSAFVYLSRDRPREIIPMGMGGGISLPRNIPSESIRREGRRRFYNGDDLEDFLAIIMATDDEFVRIDSMRQAADAKAAANRAQSRK